MSLYVDCAYQITGGGANDLRTTNTRSLVTDVRIIIDQGSASAERAGALLRQLGPFTAAEQAFPVDHLSAAHSRNWNLDLAVVLATIKPMPALEQLALVF